MVNLCSQENILVMFDCFNRAIIGLPSGVWLGSTLLNRSDISTSISCCVSTWPSTMAAALARDRAMRCRGPDNPGRAPCRTESMIFLTRT